MAEIEIRDEETTDYQRVYEVERSAFGSTLQADLVDALRESAEPKLSPVAVVPSSQRSGIGSELIRAGLDRCRSEGWLSVFLVGNPLYYSRFGFQMAKPRGFSCDGSHGPFLQYLELLPGALSGVSGLVRFHPTFSELEPRD